VPEREGFVSVDPEIRGSPGPPPPLGLSPPSDGLPEAGRRRISRSGSLLIVTGVVIIGVALVLDAIDYELATNIATIDFQQENLPGAIEGMLGAFGIVLVGAGWFLDQRAVLRAIRPDRPAARSEGATAGPVTVLVGACMLVGVELYGSFVDYLASLLLPTGITVYTFGYEEMVLGAGVVPIGVGWFLHHLGSLGFVESHGGRPPWCGADEGRRSRSS
jgi:hypothetical protein